MAEAPGVGQLVAENVNGRDAIHIAVVPVTAARQLYPGARVGRDPDDPSRFSNRSETLVGIVDPFLTKAVAEGERFWLFLYPNTITSLRHVWTHPEFETRLL